MELPEAVEAALLRGIGTYIRTADQNELPAALKRLRGFRPQALAKHKRELLTALEEGPTAALILQWLDDAKPPLSKDDAATLRVAAQGEEGWQRSFTAAVEAKLSSEDAPDEGKVHDDLERERARTAKARASERSAKEALKVAQENARIREAELTRELAGVKGEVEQLKKELDSLRATNQKLADDRARERRRAEREMEKARRATRDAQSELKGLRRDLRQRDLELADITKRLDAGQERDPNAVSGHGTATDLAARTRVVLKAPGGLLDEDPKTLGQWLQTEHVQLLVDGYNVSKSANGFSHLSLEDQRTRVIQAVDRLARKNDLRPIVVFDGARIPPGTSRRARGLAKVEYSTGEIADDHLVARLESLPPHPVVLVTDDKELQSRGRELGATVATTKQLLALAR